MVTRPTKIKFSEFKKQLNDQDGFGGCRRIVYFEPVMEGDMWRGYKYQIPMVGRKPDCYKMAYHLLFDEVDESIRERYIQEGCFKFPLSFNFSRAYRF